MKKVFYAAFGIAICCGAAHAASEEVLSLQTVREGNIEVSLPTVKLEDGSICVSYISKASRDKKSSVFSAEISRICGMPATASGTKPANLVTMGNFTSNEVTVQTPNLTIRPSETQHSAIDATTVGLRNGVAQGGNGVQAGRSYYYGDEWSSVAVPTNDKKCSLDGVTITGHADIRCTD